MDTFASAVIVFIGASILITPIWILQAIEDVRMKLAVITAFVLTCLLLLSFAMASKPFEALGVAAAYVLQNYHYLTLMSNGSCIRYAAVLMVFIQVGL